MQQFQSFQFSISHVVPYTVWPPNFRYTKLWNSPIILCLNTQKPCNSWFFPMAVFNSKFSFFQISVNFGNFTDPMSENYEVILYIISTYNSLDSSQRREKWHASQPPTRPLRRRPLILGLLSWLKERPQDITLTSLIVCTQCPWPLKRKNLSQITWKNVIPIIDYYQ